MSDGGDSMTINDELRLLGERRDDEDDVDCEFLPPPPAHFLAVTGLPPCVVADRCLASRWSPCGPARGSCTVRLRPSPLPSIATPPQPGSECCLTQGNQRYGFGLETEYV
uniref:Uncharacterized protein n=1 Tax=Oryza brachyantha TaxID=4533 RepID=J3M0L8_ORYBR